MEDNKDLDLVKLDDTNLDIVSKISAADNSDEMKQIIDLFNLNQAKKNMLRVLKLNNLLDKVSDEMIQRFNKTPGEFNNTELLDYLQVTQSAIDRATKSLDIIDKTPSIQFNQVNVDMKDDVLSRESREKIQDAIKKILAKVPEITSKSVDPIDVDDKEVIIYTDSKLAEDPE